MFYIRGMTHHTCTCTMSFTSAHMAVLYAGALRWHVFHKHMLFCMPFRHECTDVPCNFFNSDAKAVKLQCL